MAGGRIGRDPRRSPSDCPEPNEWEQQLYTDHIRGRSFRSLAQEHDCSAAHVKNIIDRVIEWRRPQLAAEMETTTQKHLDAHWHAYEEAMTAWSESRGQIVEEVITKGPNGKQTQTKRKYSAGNAAFLQQAQNHLKAYRQVIGHRPPTLDDDNDDSQRVAGLEFNAIVDRELNRLTQIRDRQLIAPASN